MANQKSRPADRLKLSWEPLPSVASILVLLLTLDPPCTKSSSAATNTTESFSLKPPNQRDLVMTSCDAKVKLLLRSFQVPLLAAWQVPGVGPPAAVWCCA